ncbi:hypothetical protein N9D38_03290 [Rubripirellula sp.]|nr:hypothetical protein [Rubripirellula sp.]
MKRRRSGPGISLFAFQDIITAVAGIFILITLILVVQLQLRKFDVDKEVKPLDPNLVSAVKEAESRADSLEASYQAKLALQGEVSELNRFNQADKLRQVEAEVLAGKRVLDVLSRKLEELKKQVSKKKQLNTDLLVQAKGLDPQKKEMADLRQKLAEYSAASNQVKVNQGVIYRDQIDSNRFICLVQLKDKSVHVKDAASKKVLDFESLSKFETWFKSSDLSKRHFLLLIEPSGVVGFDRISDELRKRSATFGFDLVEAGHEASLTFEWEVQP